MKKKIKIVFIGSVLFSKHLLEMLNKLKFIEIQAVITKQRKKTQSDYFDLSKVAKKHGLRYFIVSDINSKKSFTILKKLNAEYIFCFGWSQILKKRIINTAKNFVLGYHPSDLPSNRGRHPIIWSLALGLKRTASCFFKINEKTDDGPIVSKKYVKISKNDCSNSLYIKLIKIAKIQLRSLSYDICHKKIKIIKESKKETNYWRKRNDEDGKIDWRMTAYSINNLIKALSYPYIGAHFMYNNKEYKVFKSKVIKNRKKNIEPGKIIESKRDFFTVKCGDNALQIEKKGLKFNFKKGEYLR